MKKLLVIFMFVLISGVFVGCGSNTQDTFESAKLRVDVTTAGQIGKAVKIWDAEYNNDSYLKDAIESSGSVLSTDWTKVSDLGKIEDYVYIDNTNLVLENGEYYVAKTADEEYKIVVGVSNNNGTDLTAPKDVTKADEYDGKSAAILWVEPDDL